MGSSRRIAKYTKQTARATRQANRISIGSIIGQSLADTIARSQERKRAEVEHEQAERLIASMHAQPLPPADWYPDVENPGHWRYWDGERWTEYRS